MEQVPNAMYVYDGSFRLAGPQEVLLLGLQEVRFSVAHSSVVWGTDGGATLWLYADEDAPTIGLRFAVV
jgi:hypothetical protein